jgi:sugar lactone lactonase YvrE
MGNGLTLWRGKSLVHYTREQGLPGQKVLAVKNTPDGKLWVGTDEKGLALLQFSNDKMKAQYFDEKQGFKSQQVISVDLDNNQNLILATRGDGMARFINGGFHYLSTLDGLADNTINRVFWSPNNTVYVATNLGFNEVSQNKIYTISEDDGLINSEVQSIISDHQGNIWMGTMGGLAFFQAKTNSYRDFNEEEGLFDLKIYCLADDKFANIWMGTANGIYKYILNRDTIIRMSELELNSKIINSLLFLNDSTLIVGSNLGFNKVIFDTNIEKLIRKESYDKQNGFKFSETNQNALCKDKNGHVWFGTMGGLTCFSPELEDTIKIIPAVYITNIRLSFGNVDWSSLGVKTSDFMNLPENLSLAYTKNHVTFDFNGLYLRNPEKVLFRYKLEPYETEWSPVTQNTSVTYPGLSDNVYTFSLVASVDGVHWSAPLNYAFRITPPFWKTLWFFALCTLALITFLVFYIQRREKKLREEKEHLEQVVKERTAS